MLKHNSHLYIRYWFVILSTHLFIYFFNLKWAHSQRICTENMAMFRCSPLTFKFLDDATMFLSDCHKELLHLYTLHTLLLYRAWAQKGAKWTRHYGSILFGWGAISLCECSFKIWSSQRCLYSSTRTHTSALTNNSGLQMAWQQIANTVMMSDHQRDSYLMR